MLRIRSMPSPVRLQRHGCAVALLLLATATFSAPAATAEPPLSEAARLFAQGDFEAARLAANREAGSPESALLRGRLALFANRLEEADRWLSKAHENANTALEAAAELAELRYRQLRFDEAAALLRETGKEARANQLASLSGKVPYRVAPAEATLLELPFVQTDPLPLIEARFGDSGPVFLLIDTGASELILDPEFAAVIGARTFGKETGTFGGDAKADYELGTIDRVTLGAWTVHDVPIRLLPTRRFAAVAGGRRVDGVLGTNLLYRFRATLDYPQGSLRLERGAAGRARTAQGAIEMPFWMVGDHFLLARGSAGDLPPALFLVDTGLAGPAFAAPRSTLDALGVVLREDQALEGVGGGGKIPVVPFELSRLSIGALTRERLVGIAGAFPEKLEHTFGFQISGLVSHAFFRNHALTFDFHDMRLVLTPAAGGEGD